MNDRKPAVASAIVAVLGACLMLLLSGCSSAAPAHEAESSTVSVPSDPALMAEVQQAVDATKALTSAHLAIQTTGKIGDSLLKITGVDVDVRANPLAANGVCTYQDKSGVPFRIKDDTISVKLFDDWTTLGSVSDLAASRLVDPTNAVAKMLSGITNLQSQGSEVVDGIPTNRISGTISAETAKILDPDATKSAPTTVWIATDGSHRLVQAHVDFGSGSVQIKLSKWNEPVNI
jgi:hypothetical protein